MHRASQLAKRAPIFQQRLHPHRLKYDHHRLAATTCLTPLASDEPARAAHLIGYRVLIHSIL